MSKIPCVEIITIGDEITIGQIVDSNSTFIAKSLREVGVKTIKITSVPDDARIIVEAITLAKSNADFIFLTGGLGPTKDDITKTTLCNYFNDILVEDSAVLKNIIKISRLHLSEKKISELSKKQALVPSSAKILYNKIGTAPGLWFERDNYILVSLPGVPEEMKRMVTDIIVPEIKQRHGSYYFLHKMVYVQGISESKLAEILDSFENQLPTNISLAYLPNDEKISLRLSGKSPDKFELEKTLRLFVALLYDILGEAIVKVDDDDSVEAVIQKEFTRRGLTLSTCESCTGGMVASQLVLVEGSSAYFKGSIVAYDTDIKRSILNIDDVFINKFSTVSAAMAKRMALSAKNLLGTDYTVSITGNAGPSKDENTFAAVGTIFVGIATPSQVFTKQFNFTGHREKVLKRAVGQSLKFVLETVRKKGN